MRRSIHALSHSRQLVARLTRQAPPSSDSGARLQAPKLARALSMRMPPPIVPHS